YASCEHGIEALWISDNKLAADERHRSDKPRPRSAVALRLRLPQLTYESKAVQANLSNGAGVVPFKPFHSPYGVDRLAIDAIASRVVARAQKHGFIQARTGLSAIRR